jgi:hypothetical protein
LVAHVGCAARGWSQEYVSCERDVLKRCAACGVHKRTTFVFGCGRVRVCV